MWAVRLLFFEAGLFGVLAVGLVIATVLGEPYSIVTSLAEAAVALGCGALIGWLAHSLRQLRGRFRNPAFVVQLFLLAAAYQMIVGGVWWLGVPVGFLAVCVGGLLLAPASTDALGLR